MEAGPEISRRPSLYVPLIQKPQYQTLQLHCPLYPGDAPAFQRGY